MVNIVVSAATSRKMSRASFRSLYSSPGRFAAASEFAGSDGSRGRCESELPNGGRFKAGRDQPRFSDSPTLGAASGARQAVGAGSNRIELEKWDHDDRLNRTRLVYQGPP